MSVLKIARVITSMAIKFEYFESDNILLGEQSYENILVYEILYKILIGKKPLRIGFDKIDGFIRVYDGTRHLVLFGPEKYNGTYDRIRYLISLKSGITYAISHNFAKIKIDSCDSVLLEKNIDFA